MSAGDFTQSLQVRHNAGQASIYNPRLGKFTQPDTIIPGAANPQAFNRYAYVLNNPLNFVDPTGHCATGGIVTDTGFCINSNTTYSEIAKAYDHKPQTSSTCDDSANSHLPGCAPRPPKTNIPPTTNGTVVTADGTFFAGGYIDFSDLEQVDYEYLFTNPPNKNLPYQMWSWPKQSTTAGIGGIAAAVDVLNQFLTLLMLSSIDPETLGNNILISKLTSYNSSHEFFRAEGLFITNLTNVSANLSVNSRNLYPNFGETHNLTTYSGIVDPGQTIWVPVQINSSTIVESNLFLWNGRISTFHTTYFP